MPTNNTANVKQWLEQSNVDYFTHFVKAWIPFNAWYRHTYPALGSECEILDEIKSDGNRIRTRFMARLEGTDPESEEMRNHISALHRRLSADPLRDRTGHAISFENVCVGKNPRAKVEFTSYGWKYIVERQKIPVKQVICTIINRSGRVVSTIIQPGDWDVDVFQVNTDYLALNAKKRSPLLTCYKQANPFNYCSLLAGAAVRDTLEMDGYRFVHDTAMIFAGLVDVLYAMRNLLFHGELVPDPQTNRTYEPAYHLLRHLIEKIV